jgi:hypothetical protein
MNTEHLSNLLIVGLLTLKIEAQCQSIANSPPSRPPQRVVSRNMAPERPSVITSFTAANTNTVHLILIPGTASPNVIQELPLSPTTHPSASSWVPNSSSDGDYSDIKPLTKGSENTGQALVNMIKDNFPPGTTFDVNVYASGVPGQEQNSWGGENSQPIREFNSSMLANKIDQYPKSDAVFLVGQSHGETLAVLAANESNRGIDGIISMNAPGIAAPSSGKVGFLINFYDHNDTVATHAGNSDLLLNGPAPSAGLATNPSGFVKNIDINGLLATDASGKVVNNPTLLGIDDHTFSLNPDVIKQVIAPNFKQALNDLYANNSVDVDRVSGDAISAAGTAYDSQTTGTSRLATSDTVSLGSPFNFSDASADFNNRVTDTSISDNDISALEKIFGKLPTRPPTINDNRPVSQITNPPAGPIVSEASTHSPATSPNQNDECLREYLRQIDEIKLQYAKNVADYNSRGADYYGGRAGLESMIQFAHDQAQQCINIDGERLRDCEDASK